MKKTAVLAAAVAAEMAALCCQSLSLELVVQDLKCMNEMSSFDSTFNIDDLFGILVQVHDQMETKSKNINQNYLYDA